MTDPGTRETYEAVASEYRRSHADREAVADLRDRFLAAVERAVDAPPARVADVGCGPGGETATFAERGHDPVAVDLTRSFLRTAREEVVGADAAAFARMDMRDLGLGSGTLDGLWACASLLHVPRADVPGTLREFHRVLRPGGAVCLSVQRGDGAFRGGGYEDDRRLFTLFDPDEFRDLVADAGFEVESVEVTPVEDERIDGWIQVLGRA